MKAATKAVISFLDVERIFPQTKAGLAAFNAVIPEGQWTTLLGPSGSGKSTLLKLIAGLETLSGGRIDSPFLKNEISFVFQEHALLPWLRVIENITLPLTLRGVSKQEAEKRAEPWLQKFHLTKFKNSRPDELSGGLKMRVSLARALITEPKLLLLDEPFAALDEPIRIELGLELRELWKTHQPTILMVTHSITEGLWLADRVMVLQGQPGKVALDRKIELGTDRPLALRGTKEFQALVEECFLLLRARSV